MRVERVDHLARRRARRRASRPPSRRLVKLSARIDDAGQLLQPALDLADAAGAADAFDREIHVRDAVGIALDEQGKIDASRSSASSPQRRMTRFLERNSALAVARELDDEIPLPGRRRRLRPRNGPAHVRCSATTWSARRSVGCTSRAVACKPGERPAGARRCADNFDQRRAALARQTFALHLPMPRVLRLRGRDLAREGQAGLIGALGLDAAEGR